MAGKKDIVEQALKLIMGAGEKAARTGIKAYHSSPHDFDKFDFSKIGTGEGNQVYGRGLYFAESPAVSGQGGDYWRQFWNKMKSGSEATAANAMWANKFDRDKAISSVESQARYYRDLSKPGKYGNGPDVEEGNRLLAEEYERALELLRDGGIVGPRTYEVNIETTPDKLIDWDKPALKQPDNVLSTIKPFYESIPERKQYGETFTGGDLYRDFVKRSGGVMHSPKIDAAGIPEVLPGGSEERATRFLASKGVPGLQYLDGISRKYGDGTRNYVIFDDKIVDIEKKYEDGGAVREGYAGRGRVVGDVVDQALKLVTGQGEEAAKTGIRAYHGSPYDFDKFDMSKIGTGEGAQAYGHGLYFAEAEDVARQYRENLASGYKINGEPFNATTVKAGATTPGHHASDALSRFKGDKQAAIDWLMGGGPTDIQAAKMLKKAKSIEPWKGSMYEVNIAADPNTFLDWDKPLSEQPDVYEKLKSSGKFNVNEAVVAGTDKRLISLAGQLGINDLVPIRVQSGLRRGLSLSDALTEAKGAAQNPEWSAQVDKLAEAISPTGVEMKGNLPQNWTGQSLVDSKLNGLTKRQVSEILSKEGIPGIKYLDAGSRSAGDGTRNYVVFDDKLISIIRKYGIAGASAMLGYNLMENLDPKQALAATMADKDYQASAPQKADGGAVREGYAGKGRVVGDIVDQALKLVTGQGEEAAEAALRQSAQKSSDIPAHLLPGFKIEAAQGADEETRNLVNYLGQRDPNLAFDPQSLAERRQDLGMNVDAFHGSPRNIESFKNVYSNPQGYWGGHHYATSSPLDASVNYATPEGADLLQRLQGHVDEILDQYHPNDVIEWHEQKYGTANINPQDPKLVKEYADDYAKQILGITNEGAVYPVALRMRNPVKIDSPNQTFWDYNAEYDDDGELISEGGKAIDLIQATQDVLSEYDVDKRGYDEIIGKLYEAMNDYGGIDAKTYDDIMRKSDVYAYDASGELASMGHIMSDVFQRLGHDSIDMPTDVFAGGLGRVGMRGTGGDTRHYIVFEPKNIRSRFGAFDPFKAKSERISDADGGRVEKSDGGGFLSRAVKQLLGPSERKGLSPLTKPGSGYKGPVGKPSSVKLPFVGEAEAKPIPQIMDAATDYLKRRGVIGSHELEAYPTLDEAFAMRVAEAYDRMKHAPDDPAVRRAYDAMAQETIDQLKAAENAGIEFTAIRGKDPYAASPSLGYADIAERGNLYFFPTDAGFGSSIDFDPSQNPLLKRIGRVGDLDNATVNDAFRIVHDLYGHYGPGNPFFRAPGEERAYLLHRRMYSPEALPAMTSETRGQNSWLNYGPHGPSNRNAASEDTVFADQKTGVMEPFTYLEKAGGGAVREGYAGKGFVSDKNVEAALKYLQREFGNLPPAPVDKVFRSEGSDLVRKSRNFERGVPALGNERYGVPLTEMQAEYDEVRPLIDYLKKRPHDLVKENAVIYPAVGDLSAAGKRLAKVGDNRLANPTDLHGGFEFARDRFGQGDAPAAWASREDAANTMAERLAERTKEGEVPYLTSVSMGPEAVDSTHMMADTIIKMIPNSKIARADIAKFDAEMKKTYPDWPGIAKTDKALAFMNARGRPGSHLSDFVKKMDKKEYRAAGFPDAGEVRFAVSEPRLIGLPLGSSGFSFMKVEPTLETMTAGPQHGTYSNKIKSPEGYSGGFQNITPSRLMFPQWFEKLHPNAKVDPSKAQWSMITQFPKQKATNEWADNIEKYWEENPMPWGYADGGAVDDDIVDAVRLAKDVGGGTAPVMMEDAKGNKYDAHGNLIPPTTPGPNPARTPTPQEVGQKASMDPATFDALMQQYAVPDRDIAQYEATKAAVAAQPREIQQMTHVGDRPTREVKVDMPLFGGEYSVGSAPYDVAGNMSGVAQTAYDLKTVPFYAIPLTAPIAAGMDVAEGIATNDPLTASLAVGFGPGGKYAKAAGIGAVNYFMDPAEAEAGPARWFSKAVEAARNVPMNKMTGEQALAMLRKGVSPEELKWIGADRFLPGQESITKQDLIDYLEKNRVGTKDVVLGGNKPTRLADVKVEDIPAEIRQKYEPKINELIEKKTRANLAARGIKQSLGGDPANPLHLRDQTYLSLLQDGIDYNGEIIDLHEAMKQEYVDSIGGLGEPVRYGPGSRYGDKYVTRGGQDYRETLITLPTSEYGKLYQSGHWEGYPNVVGHIRTQILDVTPPGANRPYKAFNVDEAQSDYAKSGREKGFVTPEDKANFPKLVNQYSDLGRQRREVESIIANGDDASPEVQAAIVRATELNRQMNELSDRMTAIRSDGIPPAPYVTSTQNWTDLSIKKALDQAMDAGADYFTYTPGEAQAKRYNLRNDVEGLAYDPEEKRLSYYPKNKVGWQDVRETVEPNDIKKYIGEEAAKKLLSQEPNALSGNHILEGIDLEFGGEGMIDYYNNIYKKRVEKVVKDATGKKVQWEVIPVQTADGPREQLGFRITDMQDARFSEFNKGGRVTDRAKYADSDTVSRALALTSEV